MKNHLLLTAAFVILGIATLILMPSPNPDDDIPSSTPKPAAQIQEQRVPSRLSSSNADTAPIPVAAPAANPREQWRETLYESPSLAERLAAARQIATRNDEEGMGDLATFISAAEATGDDSLLSLAAQVAEIMGRMHGLGIEAIATELAYAPSALVAEAAVNAAVKSKPEQAPQYFTLGTGYLPTDQAALDGYAQQLLQTETQTLPPKLKP